MLSTLSTLFALSSIASASELALYWGQNSAGTETSLASYCQNTPGDIYIISFINEFGSGRSMSMNIHGYYNYISGTKLLDAPTLGEDIQTCQQLGKKVLISLGGSSGNYGFSSDADAEQVATDLWNYFGGGEDTTRPFGSNVKVDGFDLDSENRLSAPQYTALLNKLSQLYSTDTSKRYYTSAAPQCPFPDASVGDAIANSHLDYLFVQFYNNYCSMTGNNFNFNTWQSFASSQSPNRNVKIMAGLPGSSTAAGSGYPSIDQIQAKYSELTASANFGGFSVWDASQANSNIINGKSFAQQLQDLLDNAPAGTSSSEPASSTSGAASGPTSSTSGVSSISGIVSSSTDSVSSVLTTYPTETASVTSGTSSSTPSFPDVSSVATFPSVASSNTIQAIPSASPTTDVPDSMSTPAIVTVRDDRVASVFIPSSTPASSAPDYAIGGNVNGSVSAISYSTIIGTHTSIIPRTTSTTLSNGGPYETIGEATVVQVYTSVVPWEPATGISTTHSTTNKSATVIPAPSDSNYFPGVASKPAPQTSTMAFQASFSPNATWINSWNNQYVKPSATASIMTGSDIATLVNPTHSQDITTTVYETSTIRIRATSTLQVLTTSSSYNQYNNSIAATSSLTTADSSTTRLGVASRTYTTSLDTYVGAI